MSKEVVAAYFKSKIKIRSKMCTWNVELLNVSTSGTYNYHIASES
jgi:hypothetical protein